MKERGFALIFLVIILSIIGFATFQVVRGNIKVQPEVVPSPIVSPSIEPTPIATEIPSPTAIVITTPTSKPTTPPVSGSPGNGLSTINVATEKGNFAATVLSIDLSNTKIITDTANDSDCGNECSTQNLQTFVTKNGGFAGVNGTYFCPASYSECAGKTNSFDFPVYNTRLGHWINSGNIFWNGRAIVYFDGSGVHYLQNASSFSGGLTAGIVNYPGLVDGGNVQIDDGQSGLSDKQKSVGTKVGIGIRGTTNVMIVIAKNVNMQQFAHVFKSLGATGALNLDTGGSTALFYNGKYVYGPGRDIPNAIIFASK